MIDPKIYDKTLEEIKKNSLYYSQSKASNKKIANYEDSSIIQDKPTLSLFKDYFCKIENTLRKFEGHYMDQSYRNKRNSLPYIVKTLYESHIITAKDRDELIELIYFSNRTFHSINTNVSSYAIIQAHKLCLRLDESLESWESEKNKAK